MSFAPVISNDVLDLGSRRTKSCQSGVPNVEALLGAPGQFDVPNVPNVRIDIAYK